MSPTPRYTYPHTIENGDGERLTFLRRESSSTGERLIVENVVKAGSGPVMHVHHYQCEALTVRKGRIGYKRVGGPEAFAGVGQSVSFGPGDGHKFWSVGPENLECVGYIEPPDNIEYFLTEIFASQKRSGSERPGIFDAAFLATRYRSEYAMLEIPARVQRYLFPVIVAIGKALGKYKRYADAPEPIKR
jgi:mannose-6-phosphate isomerase-like protein (cupin superfamily)